MRRDCQGPHELIELLEWLELKEGEMLECVRRYPGLRQGLMDSARQVINHILNPHSLS